MGEDDSLKEVFVDKGDGKVGIDVDSFMSRKGEGSGVGSSSPAQGDKQKRKSKMLNVLFLVLSNIALCLPILMGGFFLFVEMKLKTVFGDSLDWLTQQDLDSEFASAAAQSGLGWAPAAINFHKNIVWYILGVLVVSVLLAVLFRFLAAKVAPPVPEGLSATSEGKGENTVNNADARASSTQRSSGLNEGRRSGSTGVNPASADKRLR